MADNGSNCTMTDMQIRIVNHLCSTLSLLSFIIGGISLLFNQCYYCNYKDKHQVDPMDGIFFTISIISCVYELVDFIQWILYFDNSLGCSVIGAVREYTLIGFLVAMTCLGTHLLIMMTQPRCLQVIQDEKKKRYKMLQRIYLVAPFLVPIVFVPWPFISTHYGEDGVVCWLQDSSCSADGLSNILTNLLMWFLWAGLVWLFTVVLFLLALYRYCTYKQITATRMWRLDVNVSTIIFILAAFIVGFIMKVLVFVWKMVQSDHIPFTLNILATVLTPLMFAVLFVTLIIRHVIIIRAQARKIVKDSSYLAVVTQTNRRYNATSSTCFIPPKDDEWYPITLND